MRILVMSNLYPPDFLGGYELGCRQVVDALRAAGHEVLVLAAAPRKPVPGEPHVQRRLRLTDMYDPYTNNANRPVTTRLTYFEGNRLSAFNVHVVCQAVEEFRPDVAYLWNTIGLGGLGLFAALQLLGVPWVMHLMDCVPRTLCGTETGAVIPQLADTFNRLCRGRFICCSSTTVREVCAGGVDIAGLTTLIPNWVTTDGTRDRDGHMPGGRLRVVSAGSISAVKGVDLIIRAAALLRDRGLHNLSVDLYGPCTDPAFRTLISVLGVGDRVRLMGVRAQAELDALYPQYDLFAFPTWEREPFAFAPTEAMAHGCLGVLARRCGNAEWFVDGVDCVKVDRTAESMADVWERILTGRLDPWPIARRSAQVVSARFHLRAILPRIVGVLRQAVERGAGAPARSASDAYRLAVIAEKSMRAYIQQLAG